MINIEVIRTSNNEYMLFVEHINSQWGFYVTDGNTVWDGGIGKGIYNWRKVEMPKRLTKVKARLKQTEEALLSGYGYPNFETRRIIYKNN